MSKIAKKPVEIKEGASVILENQLVKVSGPKGNLSFEIPSGINVEIKEGKVFVSQKKVSRENLKPLAGLTRAMIANLIKGVTEGFFVKLELSGVGFRAQVSGDILTLSLGFSHPVVVKVEPGIAFTVEENIITISGADKMMVGNTAAKIRNIRPPEPYKGKGIKYVGERIRRKVGKAAKAIAGAGTAGGAK